MTVIEDVSTGDRVPVAPGWADVYGAFPDAPSRQRILGELAWVAIGFDLHRWRRAIRGNRDREADLLRLLRTAGIGEPGELTADTAELDARLAVLDEPTVELDKREILERLHDAAQGEPGNATARRVARWRTLLGGVAPSIAASPVSDFPIIVEAPGNEGVTRAEVAQLLVADARSEASGRLDQSARVAVVRRVASVDLLLHDRDGHDLAEGARAFTRADGDEWAEVGVHFRAWQRGVLGELLRDIGPPPEARPRDWAAWADEPPATTPSPQGRRRLVRVAITVITSMVFVGLSLLPKQPAGLQHAQALARPAAPCVDCPPAQQLDGAGLLGDAGRVYLTLHFAARPESEAVSVRFAADRGAIVVGQAPGDSRFGVAPAPGATKPADFDEVQVERDGNSVVVSMSSSLAGAGASVSDTHVQIPGSGVLPVGHLPNPRLTLLDLALAALLGLALWRGFRRGLLALLPGLGGFALTLVAGRVLYRPLGDALAHVWPARQTSNAVALAVVITVVGLAVSVLLYAAAGRVVAPVSAWISSRTRLRSGSPPDRWLGLPVALFRSALIIAGLLVLVGDLVVLSYLRSWSETSLLSRGLMAVWRGIYHGV